MAVHGGWYVSPRRSGPQADRTRNSCAMCARVAGDVVRALQHGPRGAGTVASVSLAHPRRGKELSLRGAQRRGNALRFASTDPFTPHSNDRGAACTGGTPMKRRDVLAAAGAMLASANLPRPAIAQAAAKTLKFIPEGNLQNPDPIWSTTTVARNFGYMIWDTLYGWDGNLAPQAADVRGPCDRGRRPDLALPPARRPASSTTARRCARRIASPRSSAG